jgi:NAD(P)-dependent dehydrogenase (short-subunit alcohol dehydrogenase family)
MSQTRRLADKSVILFGGGQQAGEDVGNGRAVAISFAREGAQVAVVDRDLTAAQGTVDIIAESGGHAFAVAADVTVESEVVAAIDACKTRYGGVDIVHNNVGVGPAIGDGPIGEIDAEVFDRVMAVNLRGTMLTCRHAIPLMRQQRGGVIVNIGSVAAIINYPNAGYRVSKAAIVTLTEHIAISEAKHGIRANCILPGLMSTAMAIERKIQNGLTREEVLAERAARVPLKTSLGTAWDVANAALFLASDDARFITGVGLVVDGGQSLLAG